MRIREAESRLRELLHAAGLDCRRLDPAAAWNVFRAFAAEPVEDAGPEPDDDMCLFECGVHDWSDGNGPRFNWGFVRQFVLYDAAGEYDHMEQLHCDLVFEVTAELEGIEVPGIWSGDLGPDAWVREVERHEGFTAVVGRTPLESVVHQEEV